MCYKILVMNSFAGSHEYNL